MSGVLSVVATPGFASLRGLTIFEVLFSTLFEVQFPFRFPHAVGESGKRNWERVRWGFSGAGRFAEGRDQGLEASR
jgi:hypothetical protein